MEFARRIERKITERLAPTRLDIADDSHRHRGHGGWQPGGETHFRVTVVSPAFEGQSLVARQRLVYEILAEELAERVHALQLSTLTPDEDEGEAKT